MKDVIVALDLPTSAEALELVDRLDDAGTYYKVGAQLYTSAGPELVEGLKERGKSVFLDLKYHDIPHTVARAVEAAAGLGVDMLTLHASGGTSMLEAAREAAGPDGPLLVGVTLLTSFTAAEVEAVWDKEIRSIRDEVARLTAVAVDAGLDGVVASALEVEALKRRHGTELLVVTPGIRPAGGLAGDQVRTATPGEAVAAGADYLVIGRPIHGADDPVAAMAAVRREVSESRAVGTKT